ncbi:F0F1 ATP synthase subunit A [Rugosimonospora africana]|uniref:ATP synthase subunit a n=1 Tax=Rugosimonospora africana TaxID=556532 RepID=A0A8J3QTA6_9ACTN|nr:F0F1 ATP synthase subunit A [Rugosimonospora africana]GIH15395.1 ATP synthase subunit a [Rugosimonospora africana]
MTERSILAKDVHWPPSVDDFFLPGWHYPWVTKFTVMVWLAVAVIIVFFLVAYRKPRLVPTRTQWLAESIYGFGRNGIAGDVIGSEGVRFAPYVTTLFAFIAVMNVLGIVPGFQVAPTAHIAFPVALALISYVVYLSVGIRRHGFRRFLKRIFVPPAAPAWLLPIMAPLEALENLFLRPFTLSVRLFANMFAGHFILQVFTLGGFMLYGTGVLLLEPLSVVSWAVAIAVTFLEFMVAVLQAYVFAMLNSFYIGSSLADEH